MAREKLMKRIEKRRRAWELRVVEGTHSVLAGRAAGAGGRMQFKEGAGVTGHLPSRVRRCGKDVVPDPFSRIFPPDWLARMVYECRVEPVALPGQSTIGSTGTCNAGALEIRLLCPERTTIQHRPLRYAQ